MDDHARLITSRLILPGTSRRSADHIPGRNQLARDRRQVERHPRSIRGFHTDSRGQHGPDDVDRLLGDPQVVRSKAKIEATIDNAQTLIELDAEHGGFERYLRSRGGFRGNRR